MHESYAPDYRKLRWSNLRGAEFRHLFLLLYWPVFGLLFMFLERGGLEREYHAVHCALDDLIPFNEWFLLPYLFWFLYLVGMVGYTLLFDVPSFRKMMYFVMVTYTVTAVIYAIYPTMQQLRPTAFARDNVLTRFMGWFYQFDTNTNVCPSIHVIGSFAVMFAAWHSRHFGKTGWRVAFGVMTALISISTVFLKQHSAVDVLLALPLCLAAYWLVYKTGKGTRHAI